MADGVDIGTIDRRARAAGYDDGILEIFAAAVLGTSSLAWSIAPGLVGVLAAVATIYGWRWMEPVKRRIVYPRVGYHRERSDDARDVGRGMLRFLAASVLLMVIAVVASGDVTNAAAWRRAAPLLSGVALAGGFWFAGARSGRWRYRAISAWSVVSGLALWWVGSGDDATMSLHLAALAVPLALLGAWTLWHFVRDHPVRPADG